MAVKATQSSTYEIQSQQNQLSNLAINAAIDSNWKKAIDLNKQLLSTNPNDLEAHNRLGRAYLELGNLDHAKKTYQKVLKADPYNIIAQKNIKRLAKVKSNGKNPPSCQNGSQFDNQIFVAEPGKTKLVNLIKLTTPTILSSLCCGDEVFLQPKKHSISVCDSQDQYLGALPDDLSYHLINLLDGGNKYQAFVKKITSNCLQVFIRESFKSKKLANQPSFWFTLNQNFTSSSPKEEATRFEDFPEPEVEV